MAEPDFFQRFEMTFDQFRGGSLANFYDLAEDPTRTYDLAGKPSANVWGLFHSAVTIGGRTSVLIAAPIG